MADSKITTIPSSWRTHQMNNLTGQLFMEFALLCLNRSRNLRLRRGPPSWSPFTNIHTTVQRTPEI
ncbi:hypothetical protein ABVT39_026928 [Epinephelus coioides]